MKRKLRVLASRSSAKMRVIGAAANRLIALVEVRDVVTFGGLTMAGLGIHMVYPPAAYIVCGGALFWMGTH